MKPFDLEKALAGEPVKVRDGSKAYVLYESTNIANEFTTKRLIGYISRENIEYQQEDYPITWTKSGNTHYTYDTPDDIVGMWEEPPEMIKIGNFEFPKPITKSLNKGVRYFVAAPTVHDFYYEMEWENNIYDNDRLKAGHIHLTKEAAIQHALVLIAISQGR